MYYSTGSRTATELRLGTARFGAVSISGQQCAAALPPACDDRVRSICALMVKTDTLPPLTCASENILSVGPPCGASESDCSGRIPSVLGECSEWQRAVFAQLPAINRSQCSGGSGGAEQCSLRPLAVCGGSRASRRAGDPGSVPRRGQ